MHHPLLQAILVLLFTTPALAQEDFPSRKLIPDPQRPGSLTDSSQKNTLLRSSRSTTLNSASLSNSCGSKASFTPFNDTTLYTGQTISFTNTSTNSDSYEWIINHTNKTSSTDFTNFVPEVGVTQIMLVTYRGACTDTAVTYVVNHGTPPTDPKRMITSYGLPVTSEWADCIAQAKTDGYLLAGGTTAATDIDLFSTPYFVRVSETGCILWSRTLPELNKAFVRSVVATYDNGFVAEMYVEAYFNSTYFIKFDQDGNLLWTKYFQGDYQLNTTGALREMSDHSLMVLTGQSTSANFVLMNLDEQGNLRWKKGYLISSQGEASFVDLVEKNGAAWIAGIYYSPADPNSNSQNFVSALLKVDLAMGDLQWYKSYKSPNKEYTFSGIHFYKDGLIMNGVADSLLDPSKNRYNQFESLLETDLDGNVREASLIYNTTDLYARFGDNLFVNPDNTLSLFYSGIEKPDLQAGTVNHAYYLRLDADKNMLWQNEYTGSAVGYMMQAVTEPARGLAMTGYTKSSLLNPVYGFSNNMVLVKVDSNGRGPDAQCDMYETFTTMKDMVITSYSPVTVMESNGPSLFVADLSSPITPANSEIRYHCPDYVPPCSFMKLSGKYSVCNLKDTFDFIAHKDPSCADPVTWTYDNVNIKTVYKEGGKVRLLFNAAGTYFIKAEKQIPCAHIIDSMLVTVAPGLINFSLGNDTTLCIGDSLLLKPPGRYNTYLWQDGSTYDSFMVKTAGDYRLTVTDSCGNTKPDMIHVDFRSSIPVDLGAPQTKCKTDSLLIAMPGGFQKYVWTPMYNIMVSSDNSDAILFPSQDTVYHLMVTDAGGCSGTGDLPIHILPSIDFSLGKDTAICAGGSASFSAGTGFSSYAWSNGASSPSIIINVAGQYSVVVKDQNGCKQYDTVSLTVYPIPDVQITGGTVICKDQSLSLDAGAGFVSYLWQNGSQARTFNVTDTGYFRVQVTDPHQCTAADSLHITQIAEPPQQFLPSDTIVCSYLGALIQPKSEFAQYSWSTGETGKSIQVKTAGEYILRVVDQEGCKGSDSILVTMKDCEALLVFPNAFTPNHDGHNDVFRLKYPGHAADYRLQIFNRWGQKIFETTDTSAGWDGEHQPDGNYVWIVRYTDNSGKKQILQGTVVLIR